jgi:hypothetical protein
MAVSVSGIDNLRWYFRGSTQQRKYRLILLKNQQSNRTQRNALGRGIGGGRSRQLTRLCVFDPCYQGEKQGERGNSGLV